MKWLALILTLSLPCSAQLWSGILNTIDTSPCSASTPTACAPGIDVWKTAGVVGGIPTNYTQSGSTITAASCSNGASDCEPTIQSALNSCGGTSSAGKYVALGSGTFLIKSPVSIPSYCYLTGQGANNTILVTNNSSSTSAGAVTMGTSAIGSPPSTNATITAGNTEGSTQITVSSTSGMSVGTMLYITELNDASIYVTDVGGNGSCSWCDYYSGARVLGQLSQITNISSLVVTINPGLFRDLPSGNTPYAAPYTAQCNYCGLENLQIQDYGNSNSNQSDVLIWDCDNCWVLGIQVDYTSADFVDLLDCWHCEVDNNYFSNSYNHGAGNYDSEIGILHNTTVSLMQNNICERTHDCFILAWGPSGNVIAYNFCNGNFSTSSAAMSPNICIAEHGAHPQFNLIEGNIGVGMANDSTWGSGSMDTLFRDWFLVAQMSCDPQTATTDAAYPTVTCSPIGNFGAGGVNSWWEYQEMAGVNLNYLDSSTNVVGSLLGSEDMSGTTQGCGSCTSNSENWAAISQTPSPSCPTGANCGSNSRPYNNAAFSLTFGYAADSDTGAVNCSGGFPYTSPCDNLLSWNTLFLHGTYTTPNSTMNWASGVTHTLPASFYLSSAVKTSANTPCGSGTSFNKNPTLGTCQPFPPVAPDLWTAGLADAYTYAYMNPAMNCYFNVMGGAWGGPGTPLTFNAASCYAADPAIGQPGLTINGPAIKGPVAQ